MLIEPRFTQDELAQLHLLLSRELESSRIELHHTAGLPYREYLKNARRRRLLCSGRSWTRRCPSWLRPMESLRGHRERGEFNEPRCVMEMIIQVGNLASSVNSRDLLRLFEPHVRFAVPRGLPSTRPMAAAPEWVSWRWTSPRAAMPQSLH